jgi:hypothetical protein
MRELVFGGGRDAAAKMRAGAFTGDMRPAGFYRSARMLVAVVPAARTRFAHTGRMEPLGRFLKVIEAVSPAKITSTSPAMPMNSARAVFGKSASSFGVTAAAHRAGLSSSVGLLLKSSIGIAFNPLKEIGDGK